jgi:hypothetical protein
MDKREQVKHRNRQAVLDAIVKAGPAGIEAKTIAEMTGLGVECIYMHVTALSGVMRMAPRGQLAARLFGPGHEAQALAFSQSVAESRAEAAKTRLKWSSGTVAAAVEAVLMSGKQGAPINSVAAAIGCNEATAGRVLLRLHAGGTIDMRRIARGARVYYGIGMAPPIMPRVRNRSKAAKALPKPVKPPKAKPKPVNAAKPVLASLGPSLARAKMQGEAIIPAGLKVQVIPHNEDTRYTPTNVRPFFSQPGFRPDYLSTDTWAARAYGGQR